MWVPGDSILAYLICILLYILNVEGNRKKKQGAWLRIKFIICSIFLLDKFSLQVIFKKYYQSKPTSRLLKFIYKKIDHTVSHMVF